MWTANFGFFPRIWPPGNSLKDLKGFGFWIETGTNVIYSTLWEFWWLLNLIMVQESQKQAFLTNFWHYYPLNWRQKWSRLWQPTSCMTTCFKHVDARIFGNFEIKREFCDIWFSGFLKVENFPLVARHNQARFSPNPKTNYGFTAQR